MINLPVLVLNQTYEPLNICRVRRALVLIDQGKAEMLENGYGYVHTSVDKFPVPSVIKLQSLIRRPRVVRRKLTRYEVFQRDNYTCQYCGKTIKQLTIDHVIPRYRGGRQTWDNVVSACVACNRRKAGLTPKEANMKLLKMPVPAKENTLFYIPYHLQVRNEWVKYLPSGN